MPKVFHLFKERLRPSADCQAALSLDSTRIGDASLRFLSLALGFYLVEGMFYYLAVGRDPLWWWGSAVSIPLVIPVLRAGKRVYLMWREAPALGFADDRVVDFRALVPRVWRLDSIESLSPPIESLWDKSESLRDAQIRLDMENFVSLRARRRGRTEWESVFSDHVEIPFDSEARAALTGIMARALEKHGFTHTV